MVEDTMNLPTTSKMNFIPGNHVFELRISNIISRFPLNKVEY